MKITTNKSNFPTQYLRQLFLKCIRAKYNADAEQRIEVNVFESKCSRVHGKSAVGLPHISIDIYLPASQPFTARTLARVFLHECQHAVDGLSHDDKIPMQHVDKIDVSFIPKRVLDPLDFGS